MADVAEEASALRVAPGCGPPGDRLHAPHAVRLSLDRQSSSLVSRPSLGIRVKEWLVVGQFG